MRVGKFEVYPTKNGKWRFRLKAGNGEIIAQGEEYETRQGCLKGIASIQRNARKAEIQIIAKDNEVLSSKGLVSKIVKEEISGQALPAEKVNQDEKKLLVDPKNNPVFKLRRIPLPGEYGPKWL